MVIGILLSYGTLIGRDAGVALLILLGGMKFLEIRNKRDYYIACFIGLFLILTNFLYTQSIITALYMLLVIIIFICTLITFNDQDHFLRLEERFKTASIILLEALPLMLIIFVLFPRIPGPLWGLPRDAHSGLSGVNDEMSPGSISQLTLSDEVAFRVKFHGAVPDKSSLYWRGPVLWQTDGVKWVPDKPRPSTTGILTRGSPIEYTVILEPIHKNWLYAMELPIAPPPDSFFTHDLQIKTASSEQKRRQYTLTSYTDFRIETNSHTELIQALQLPYGYHSKTIELAAAWRAAGQSDIDIVNRALRMFNQEEFYYTLSPPLIQGDTIDGFLFDTRQGFCEHYASAFTVMMRAAGIPARVVVGYQGGTINPIDNYLVVRQRDAHAWSEVWLEDRGWIRVDPTSAVSPARVMEGIENALPGAVIDIPLGLHNNKTARDLMRRFRDTFDAINNRWNQWVLAYDNKKQLILFQKIGFKNDVKWTEMILWLVFSLVSVFAVVSFLILRQRPDKTDSAKRLYDQFCRKMAKLGINRYAFEGPKDFASRAITQRDDLRKEINDITDLYIAVRYGDQMNLFVQLKQCIKTFKPVKHITA